MKLEVYGVAETLGEDLLVRAVGVHADQGGAEHFALLAVVAGGAGGEVDAGAAVQGGDRNGAGEMPAAVFVIQAVVGEADEGFGRGGGVRCRRRCTCSG